MCVIKEGVEVYLISGGNVMFPNGDVYSLSDCKLTGGTLILGVGEVEEESPYVRKALPRRVKRKKNIGKSLIIQDDVGFGDYSLDSLDLKTLGVVEVPEKLESVDYPNVDVVGFGVVFALIMTLFKKVAGLNRELKGGSCEVRHIEAITRISKLEGKVLRKQIVDGGKFIKEKYDNAKKDEEK